MKIETMIQAINRLAADDVDPFAIVTGVNGFYAVLVENPDEPIVWPISSEDIAAMFAKGREAVLDTAVDVLKNDAEAGDGPAVERAGEKFLVDGQALNVEEFVAFAKARDVIAVDDLHFAA
jgi:hypothetical protein